MRFEMKRETKHRCRTSQSRPTLNIVRSQSAECDAFDVIEDVGAIAHFGVDMEGVAIGDGRLLHIAEIVQRFAEIARCQCDARLVFECAEVGQRITEEY